MAATGKSTGKHAGWLLAVTLLIAGCTPKIGDECVSSIDCSTLGDRLCDTTQPDGYCTLFNCEPNECPDEALCIAFNGQLDPACGTLDDGQFGRFGRTFCMRVCDDQSDCRDGYTCARPVDQQARVIDTDTPEDNPQDNKVCLATSSQPSIADAVPNACMPNDGVGGLTPYQPGAGGAGQGGAGQGGAGGSGMGGMSVGGAGGASAGGAGGA